MHKKFLGVSQENFDTDFTQFKGKRPKIAAELYAQQAYSKGFLGGNLFHVYEGFRKR